MTTATRNGTAVEAWVRMFTEGWANVVLEGTPVGVQGSG